MIVKVATGPHLLTQVSAWLSFAMGNLLYLPESWRCNHPSMAFMMTSSNGNIIRIIGHLCGDFTGHRWIPLTKASDSELWCSFSSAPEKKRLSKQSRGWWFEMSSRSLWRQSNVAKPLKSQDGWVVTFYRCDYLSRILLELPTQLCVLPFGPFITKSIVCKIQKAPHNQNFSYVNVQKHFSKHHAGHTW